MIKVTIIATLTGLPKPLPAIMAARQTVYVPALPRPGDTMIFRAKEDDGGPEDRRDPVEEVFFDVSLEEVEVSLGAYQYPDEVGDPTDWTRFGFEVWDANLPEDNEGTN